MMYVHWKSLASLGIAFWMVLWFTDLLGESTWKRYSQHLEEILTSYFEEVSKMQSKKSQQLGHGESHINWWLLFCNICAFLCSLMFCSFVKSTTWVVWNVFVAIKNFYQNKTLLADTMVSSAENSMKELAENSQNVTNTVANCKVLFKNQSLSSGVNVRLNNKRQPDPDIFEALKKANSELSQQLIVAQDENRSKCKQLEELKIEMCLMREKFNKTAHTLKQNMKNKDFVSANQELISRKARNLEQHLQDVSRDRDLLKNKLCNMDKTCKKLEERVKFFEKQQAAHLKDVSEIPEKDENIKSTSDTADSEVTEPEVDMTKFQTRLMELQRNINNFSVKTTNSNSNTNSKISMDLDESSNDTKDTEQEIHEGAQGKVEMTIMKQNLLNYNVYDKAQTRSGDDSSSSDEPSSPKRIISSTLEFQNFLKTLNTNSNTSYTINKNPV